MDREAQGGVRGESSTHRVRSGSPSLTSRLSLYTDTHRTRTDGQETHTVWTERRSTRDRGRRSLTTIKLNSSKEAAEIWSVQAGPRSMLEATRSTTATSGTWTAPAGCGGGGGASRPCSNRLSEAIAITVARHGRNQGMTTRALPTGAANGSGHETHAAQDGEVVEEEAVFQGTGGEEE